MNFFERNMSIFIMMPSKTVPPTGPSSSRSSLLRVIAALSIAAAVVAGVVVFKQDVKPPEAAAAIQARLVLSSGDVLVEHAKKKHKGVSDTPLHEGAMVATQAGARALLRLPDGTRILLREKSKVALRKDGAELLQGECWLDVPPAERKGRRYRASTTIVTAADAGLNIKRNAAGIEIYVARGMAVVSAKGGRVEVNAGERAHSKASGVPKVEAVAFWEDWTGGMADRGQNMVAGAGSGRIYGVGLRGGSAAKLLQIKSQSVRAAIRGGLSETEVDQTFFNPTSQNLEGWYWFTLPVGANVTSFAVETNGSLIAGEVIEKKQASRKYARAKSSGHAPAILEWIDGRNYRARIYPVPASGTRRVVLRYMEMRPLTDARIHYSYPMGRGKPVRIGEFSLRVDLGKAGSQMKVATLADARVEAGGRRVTMRRSGYTPRADFQLEAKLPKKSAALRLARFQAGGERADYIMARYIPDVDWASGAKPRADVVVVVDTSAAGDEAARRLNKTAAEAVLRGLSSGDRFALVSLDVKPTVLYPAKDLAVADSKSVAVALEKLAERSAGGATDLSSMFEVALERLHGAEQPAVIYIGDGVATSGANTGEQLAKGLRRAMSTSRARLFTVAVGADADAPLLAELARTGGGKFYRVESANDATSRALQIAAAVKVPTITDFELDLGAGLDEVFLSASGKLSQGMEVVLLARSHHDIPDTATVRGRLGGKAFEKKVVVHKDKSVATAFVPRLWAAAYVDRLLGGAGGAQVERGRIVALGREYGLVTPFTSILALESEQAYRRMNIPRSRSRLRGVRLGSLSPRAEDRLIDSLHVSPAKVAIGCGRNDASPQNEAGIERPQRVKSKAAQPQMVAQKPARPSSHSVASPEPAAELDDEFEEPKDEDGAPPPRAYASKPAKADKAQGLGASGSGRARGSEGRMGRAAARPKKRRERKSGGTVSGRKPSIVRVCSDVARRPLAQRATVWRRRLATADNAYELLSRYRSAQRGCELDDWRSERLFLYMMQLKIKTEGATKVVLRAMAARPQVQKYVARFILRRANDKRMVAAVREVLFGGAVNWGDVDRKASEIEDLQKRIAYLRSEMRKAPGDPDGDLRLVKLLVKAGRVSEALSHGRKLRDRGLMTLATARSLGDVLVQAKRKDEALRTYSEIVEFDPNSSAMRQRLGDIYLARGWYEPAYRQFRTALAMHERTPSVRPNMLTGANLWLRVAASAAGSGRVDEALRIERKVATAQGRPGPRDPRRWARLWSAARIARLLAKPDAAKNASLTQSMTRRLKQLQLFDGVGTLVLLTWEDLERDLVLELDNEQPNDAERIDAARTGLSAMQFAEAPSESWRVRLRNLPYGEAVRLRLHSIRWDGKDFAVKVKDHNLSAGETNLRMSTL